MTIRLPESVESSIREVVRRGEFASVDDAMTKAALLLLGQSALGAETREGEAGVGPATSEGPAIWDVIDDLRKSVPSEEFLKLPRDGAEQLDHYLYGAPKRPAS